MRDHLALKTIFQDNLLRVFHAIHNSYERPPVLRDHNLLIPRGGLIGQGPLFTKPMM